VTIGFAVVSMIVWALGAMAVARRVVVRAHRTQPGDLGRPYGHTEIALLSETTTRAILASIGALRAAGVIDAEDGQTWNLGVHSRAGTSGGVGGVPCSVEMVTAPASGVQIGGHPRSRDQGRCSVPGEVAG
jgi:hypothetical protein